MFVKWFDKEDELRVCLYRDMNAGILLVQYHEHTQLSSPSHTDALQD